HFDHRDLAAAAPVDADLTRHDAIAVQNLLHLARADEAVRPTVLAHEKAVAVGMSLHPATDEIELVDQAQRAAAVLHHATLVLEVLQRLLKLRGCGAAEAEATCELARLQR